MTVSVKNSLFNSIRENKVTMFISLLNPRYIYIFLPRYKGVAKQHMWLWSKCSTKTFWVSICCGHVTWVFRNICKTDGFLGFFWDFDFILSPSSSSSAAVTGLGSGVRLHFQHPGLCSELQGKV